MPGSSLENGHLRYVCAIYLSAVILREQESGMGHSLPGLLLIPLQRPNYSYPAIVKHVSSNLGGCDSVMESRTLRREVITVYGDEEGLGW